MTIRWCSICRGRRVIKRSTAIKLLLAGTGGAAIAAAMTPREKNCVNNLGEPVTCRSSSSSSSSRSSSGWGYSSGRSTSQTTVARGGFGSTGSSVSS